MIRPSKEEIDRILDPKKIAAFINEDGQLNTEVDYESSNLEMYLKYDLWEEDNALIILCGIDPLLEDRDIDFDDYGFVKIKHTYFFGRPATYDVPSRDEIYGWLKECNEEYTAFIETNGLVPPDPPGGFLERKWHIERNAILDNLYMFEELLSNKYFDIVWSIREQHARNIMRRRLLWKSGRHEDRNPPGYYIDWALKKGFPIHWLEWAKSKGLLPPEITDSDSSTNKMNQIESIGEYPWCGFARSEGKKFVKENPLLSLDQIADKVFKSMTAEEVTGRGGRVPSAGTIKRHALTGIKS